MNTQVIYKVTVKRGAGETQLPLCSYNNISETRIVNTNPPLLQMFNKEGLMAAIVPITAQTEIIYEGEEVPLLEKPGPILAFSKDTVH